MQRVVKKVIRIAKHYQIDVEIEPSLFARCFGAQNKTFIYHGSGGTVWYQFPYGNRASSWMESFLCDAVAAHKVKGEALSPA